MALLLTVLIFLTVMVLTVTVARSLSGERGTVANRIKKHILSPSRMDSTDGILTSATVRTRKEKHGGRGLSLLFARIEERMGRAGMLMQPREFLLLSVGIAAVFGLAGWVLTMDPFIGVCSFLLGGVTPYIYSGFKITRRRKEFSRQLGDTLLLLSNGLKAGHALIQCFEMVARELPPPISDEIKLMLRETILGVPLEEALIRLDERVQDDDLSLIVTAILIQHQVGGNLADILEKISHTIRERIRLKKEVATLTAQGKLSAVVVSLLPAFIAAFIFTVAPEFLGLLLDDQIGRIMILAAVVLEIIGFLFIRRIIDIKL